MAEEIGTPERPWSKTEEWVWEQVAAGKIADLNAFSGQAQPLDPSKPDGWGDSRRLHVSFLQAILTKKSFVDAMPFQGVRILGALVDGDEPLDLAHARLGRLLWLEMSRLLVNVDCRDLRVDGELSLEGCYLGGTLSLYEARIDGALSLAETLCKSNVNLDFAKVGAQLSMDDATFESDVNLNDAKIGGKLSMNSATFEGTVSMDSLEVARSLFMSTPEAAGSSSRSKKATFKGDVNLGGARIGGQLSMIGATFEGALDMNGLEVKSDLFMSKKATFKGDVNLSIAKIGRVVSMEGSTFEGEVNLAAAKFGWMLSMNGATFKRDLAMYSLDLAGSLSMSKLEVAGDPSTSEKPTFEKASFEGEVKLAGAKVGGQISMNGSTFKSALALYGLEVTGSLFMGEQATFEGEVNLTGAKVRGDLSMSGSTFKSSVKMESLAVAGDLFMSEKASFAAPVYFLFGRVGGYLDLSGAMLTLAELDLSGTQITGELRLGSGNHPPAEWRDSGSLVLRNAHAGALQDRIDGKQDAWPREGNLKLDGFTYDRLGGFKGGGSEADMLGRETDWYEHWLERDPTYSPQPYEQLAKVFRASGHPTKANDILYASRERERKEARALKRFVLNLLNCLIGYGLGPRYFWSLRSVLFFTALGTGLLWSVSQLYSEVPDHGLAWNFACSLDLLLPVVEFNKAHGDFVITITKRDSAAAWIKYYFYFHKLVGWVLASFLIAGLAGLTQKS